MPMKPRYLNSIPAAAKPRKPICGLTAATTCNRDPKSSSSTIKPAAAVAMRSNFWATGTVSYWLMITVAIKPCLPPLARIRNRSSSNPALSSAAWRKFFDLLQASQSPIAQEALCRIAKLYAVEAQARESSTAERKHLRAEQSLPQLAALHDWLQQTRLRTAPGTATAKAIDYSLKRWAALSRYAETGDLPIDNNPVENCIRPIALGKKTGCLQDRNAPASALRSSKPCSARPSSMALILLPG